MEVKGKITAVPRPVSGTSAKGEWKKASIVVEYEGGQYPKSLLLSNMKKADEFSRLRVGQTGTFKFDGNVRQASNGNYYLDLTCWAWDIDQQQSYAPAPAPSSAPQKEDEDLPF